MTDLLQILQHAIGVDQYGQGEQYRNHFATGEGSIDHPICMDAVARKLMLHFPNQRHMGGMDMFIVSDAGRDYVAEHSPKPPKLTVGQRRYRDWLHVNDALNVSFIDYCRIKTATSS